MREPRFAGAFYPADKEELSEMVQGFLEQAEKPVQEGKIVAAIVPHAGYAYSGPVAAKAYRLIAEEKPEKIVLTGPSHREYIKGAKTFSQNWITPLGEVQVESAGLEEMNEDLEHSLEVQIPFLQETLGKFCLTPIIYGEILGKELSGIMEKEEGFFLVSSDLSHFMPYEEANEADRETIDAVLGLDEKALKKKGDACGITGIMALVLLAKKKGWKPRLLDYRNSGDTTGDKSKVVGYASIIFTE